MDEDSDASNWVLVEDVDCAEEAISLNHLAATPPPVSLDSDQESDGGISIISDQPNDSYSEEEIEAPSSDETTKKSNYFIPKITPIIKIDTEFETNDADIDEGIENEIQKLEAMEVLQTNGVEDVSQKVTTTINENAEFKQQAQKLETMEEKEEDEELKTEMEDDQKVTSSQASDDDVSSTSESSSGKQWTFVNEKSTPEESTAKIPFFLDCSQEPILEVSAATDTDVDTESTTSFVDNQAVVRHNEASISTVPNRDTSRNQREFILNHISIGFLLSVVILASSHLIGQYLEYTEDSIQSPIYSSSFLESIMDNEGARPIVDFCIDRQKSKGGEYSERAVEKCVTRRLRKKNKEDEMKKTEIYLQMKERVLELREKELAEKERQILQKWRKRAFDDVGKEKSGRKYEKKADDGKEENIKSSKEHENKLNKKWNYKEIKYQSDDDDEKPSKIDDIKGKIKTFRKKSTWVFESAKEANNVNYKAHSKEDLENNKRSKKVSKVMEETLKSIKDQGKNTPKEKFKMKEETMKKVKNHVKAYQKDRPARKLKNKKNNKKEKDEEWYIKYNPIKNTIKLINITTLPEQDSLLIRNGNKTINGQWYFSLYGSGRSSIRSREKAAEWYFRRGHLRENKRDKAKWYFDYMSARDNTRYFY